MKFTVLLTPDEEDGGYVAECPTIPGCVSEGDTVELALANIKEAIEACLESLVARQQPLPHEGGVIVATVDADLPAEVKT
jgi:predicted RNase H-like HicB family nuclease